MTRRGAFSPEDGSTPVKKRSPRAQPRLVADNPTPEADAAEAPAPEAVAVDDSAPLTLEPNVIARPARAKRPVRAVAASPAPSIPPVMRPARDRRRTAIGAVLVICIGGALVAGVVKAVTSRNHRLTSAATAPLASAVPEAKPILADYAPPDRDQVRRAFVNVGATYRTEGLSGVVRNTMDCFSGLEQTPSYGALDYCIAVDAYGEALQRKLAGDQPLATDSYFTGAQPRELKAARGVVSADGDAGARVLDVRRLAAEVSQAGPAAAAVVVAANDQTASEHPTLATPAVTEAPPALLPHTAAHPTPFAAPVEPAPARVIAVKTPPAARPRAVPAPPVVHARAVHVRADPALLVLRAHAITKAPTRPHVQKASVRAPAHVSRPKLVKISTPVRRPTSTYHRTVVEHARPHTERPNLIKATVAMVRRAFAHKPAPAHATHHNRDWDPDERDSPRPLRIAARSHTRDHYNPQQHRASEPSEWVDCRHPRGANEVRMCEGPTYGGGTLDDQYQHDRGRYR